MDKNTITGLVLIGVIFFGFFFLNQPSEEQLKEQKRVQDSIALVRENQARALDGAQKEAQLAKANEPDSVKALVYGVFAAAAKGTEDSVVLKNGNVTVTISTKGACVKSVN